MRIQTTAVTDEFSIRCPSCSTPLLVSTPNHSKVPDGGYIIDDGDSIFGVWQGLSEAERARAWDAAFSAGACRSCGTRYYFANLGFSEAERSDLVQEYLYQNMDPSPETNFVCSAADGPADLPAEWLMHQWQTEIGIVQHHYLGPWILERPEEVETEYGITACRPSESGDTHWHHVSRMALAAWPELRRICAEHTARAAA
jgi:hypothetical protein